MSITKRIFIEYDPAYAEVRERYTAENSEYLSGFEFRIPTRRRNPRIGSHWDPLWPSSLRRAAQQLKIEIVQINDGIFTRTIEQRNALIIAAEAIWGSR